MQTCWKSIYLGKKKEWRGLTDTDVKNIPEGLSHSWKCARVRDTGKNSKLADLTAFTFTSSEFLHRLARFLILFAVFFALEKLEFFFFPLKSSSFPPPPLSKYQLEL